MNIFEGIDKSNLKPLFDCLQAVKKTYKKDEIIIDIGGEITSVAYIIEGKVQIAKDNYEGSRVIISTLDKDDIFAEAFVCAGIEKSVVCATALEETQILFLNFNRILTTCTNACQFHQKLIENIIRIVSCKNIMLQERIELLAKKTLRERILHLLYKENAKTIGDFINLPYSREQMAQYIGADRSALSRELSNMKTNGIIDFHKNTFKLLN